MNVKTYSEKERRCNASFLSAGPYWHAYTSGKETPLLFSCTQDFAFAMNVVAQASNEFKGVTILAFEILNNHFHFVLSAEESGNIGILELLPQANRAVLSICKRH